ncbi:hypothetical protein XELAEV_18043505mg [Xenopus laevis]|nr:hypothetical protein XELAEV_18043505mg [Xenopus laevis]
MAERSCTSGQKSPESSVQNRAELEKQIYNFLKHNGQQKAVTIGKALQTEKNKINSVLYDMKSKNLLSHNEKMWSVTQVTSQGDLLPSEQQSSSDRRLSNAEQGTKLTKPRDLLTSEQSSSDRSLSNSKHGTKLTKLQKDIYLFLKVNGQSKALNIAHGVNKTTAREVNPDLYQLNTMNLLQKDPLTNLWSVKPGMEEERAQKFPLCDPVGTDVKTCNCYLCQLEQSLKLRDKMLDNTDVSQSESVAYFDNVQPENLSEISDALEKMTVAGEATNDPQR